MCIRGRDNIPYETDRSYLQDFCAENGIKLHILHSSFDESTDPRKTRCFLCEMCIRDSSGARPGARREIVEAYIKRLNDLEAIAMSYPGVTKTYEMCIRDSVRSDVCRRLLSDSNSRWTPLPLAR